MFSRLRFQCRLETLVYHTCIYKNDFIIVALSKAVYQAVKENIRTSHVYKVINALWQFLLNICCCILLTDTVRSYPSLVPQLCISQADLD